MWRIWLDTNESLKSLKEDWTYEEYRKANALLDMQKVYESVMTTDLDNKK